MIPAHVRNRNAVILKVLEATLGEQSAYWTADGPTRAARELRDVESSDAARVWVRLAWALYDGSGGLTIAELLETEEQKCIIALTLLMRIPMGNVGLASILAAGSSETDDGGGESLN